MHSFIEDLLIRILPEIGAAVTFEPITRRLGYITFRDGRRSYFRDNRFSINDWGSVAITADKAATTFFLGHHGFRVPRTMAFWHARSFPAFLPKHTPEMALAFAEQLGFPVYVKPNDLSQGTAVYKVSTHQEFYQAAEHALAASRRRVALVQEQCMGRDFRIVVLDGEVISSYERVPFHVVGDGHSSIQRLINDKQAMFRHSGRDTTIAANAPATLRVLARSGMSLGSVPERNTRVILSDVSNLSVGGECVDLTACTHEDFKQLARSIAKAMQLRLCGIDLMASDIWPGTLSHYRTKRRPRVGPLRPSGSAGTRTARGRFVPQGNQSP
jgi:D-alanine-D-alanine ligase-like ATP-grasp enzyme